MVRSGQLTSQVPRTHSGTVCCLKLWSLIFINIPGKKWTESKIMNVFSILVYQMVRPCLQWWSPGHPDTLITMCHCVGLCHSCVGILKLFVTTIDMIISVDKGNTWFRILMSSNLVISEKWKFYTHLQTLKLNVDCIYYNNISIV